MGMSLKQYKHFIDEEMIIILRQMDSPSLIFDHLYLGSEWNASNLAELRQNGWVFAAVWVRCVCACMCARVCVRACARASVRLRVHDWWCIAARNIHFW